MFGSRRGERLGGRVGPGGKDLADQMNELGLEGDEAKLEDLFGSSEPSLLGSLLGGREQQVSLTISDESRTYQAIKEGMNKLPNGFLDLKQVYQVFLLACEMKKLSGVGVGVLTRFKGGVAIKVVYDSQQAMVYEVSVKEGKIKKYTVLPEVIKGNGGSEYLTRIALQMQKFIDP